MKRALFALFIIGLALLFGILERESAITADSLAKDHPTVFTTPLPCDAVVSQRSAAEQWIQKCYYFPRGN